MPTYFIDTDDGDLAVIDDEGVYLPSDNAAKIAGLRAFPDMVREKILVSDTRTFTVQVRSEDRRLIYSAVLKLDGGIVGR